MCDVNLQENRPLVFSPSCDSRTLTHLLSLHLNVCVSSFKLYFFLVVFNVVILMLLVVVVVVG